MDTVKIVYLVGRYIVMKCLKKSEGGFYALECPNIFLTLYLIETDISPSYYHCPKSKLFMKSTITITNNLEV